MDLSSPEGSSSTGVDGASTELNKGHPAVNGCVGFPGQCTATHQNGYSDRLCGFCLKMDVEELQKMFGDQNNLEGLTEVGRLMQARQRRVDEARSQGLLVCALENPRWHGQEWRRRFRAISIKPCDFLRKPGADEGRFCENCIIHECITIRYPMETRWNEKLKQARVYFPCIWADEKMKEHPFRMAWARSWHCPSNSPTKYPASMCMYCWIMLGYEADGFRILSKYFHDDGRLKDPYFSEHVVPTVSGELSSEEYEQINRQVVNERLAFISSS